MRFKAQFGFDDDSRANLFQGGAGVTFRHFAYGFYMFRHFAGDFLLGPFDVDILHVGFCTVDLAPALPVAGLAFAGLATTCTCCPEPPTPRRGDGN
jgi:hypothetical protein